LAEKAGAVDPAEQEIDSAKSKEVETKEIFDEADKMKYED